ncbi:MAG TPA: FAD:protein FMN transferase [Planctomycetota bacterium]|jgi:thiamine biosynthesis lipoprotein|nr:FAD:protein FMN transferase [Planctomycetota bacterium]
MGSPCRIALYAPDEAAAKGGADAAFAEIAALDASMSDWKPDSELSRLNGRGELEVSAPLFEVLESALRFAELSGGAFDPTVGPAVAVWREKRIPSEPERAAILERIGWRNLELAPSRRFVRLARPGMKVDLGGIAKGYAADRALAALRGRGIASAFVAVAGDIALGDPPPGEEGWRIGIAGAGKGTLLLRNRGVSTSGDLERFLEIGGERYSHIVDPRTGVGLRGRAAATVVAADATTSDALATALCVLGVREGIALAALLPGVEARVRSDAGEGETPGFASLLEATSPAPGSSVVAGAGVDCACPFLQGSRKGRTCDGGRSSSAPGSSRPRSGPSRAPRSSTRRSSWPGST